MQCNRSEGWKEKFQLDKLINILRRRRWLAQNLEEYLQVYKKKWKVEIRHNGDRNNVGQGTRKINRLV